MWGNQSGGHLTVRARGVVVCAEDGATEKKRRGRFEPAVGAEPAGPAAAAVGGGGRWRTDTVGGLSGGTYDGGRERVSIAGLQLE